MNISIWWAHDRHTYKEQSQTHSHTHKYTLTVCVRIWISKITLFSCVSSSIVILLYYTLRLYIYTICRYVCMYSSFLLLHVLCTYLFCMGCTPCDMCVWVLKEHIHIRLPHACRFRWPVIHSAAQFYWNILIFYTDFSMSQRV